MTTNRLAMSDGRSGRVTAESLQEYADRLNGMRWVNPNKPYFVNTRIENGVEVRFLDRNG